MSLFKSIIKKEVFESLTTSERIKFLIAKGILYFNSGSPDLIYCIDFENLHFEELDGQEFDFEEIYELKLLTQNQHIVLKYPGQDEILHYNSTKEPSGISISLSCHWGLHEEIYQTFLNEINQSLTFIRRKEGIALILKNCVNEKEKQRILIDTLKELNLFQFKHVVLDLDSEQNEINIFYDTLFNFFELDKEILKDWITKSTNSTLITSRPQLMQFKEELVCFHLAEFCLFELKQLSLKSNTRIIPEQQGSKADPFTVVYLLSELGVLTKLEDDYGMSDMRISMIISKLTSTHPDNIRKHLRRIRSPQPLGSKFKNRISEINKMLGNT